MDLVKYRISLLIIVMMLQVKDRTTTSSKLVRIKLYKTNKDTIRELKTREDKSNKDRIRGDRVREDKI